MTERVAPPEKRRPRKVEPKAKQLLVLEQMRNNPKGDWSINDVRKLCDHCGVDCMPPTRGTHYKVASDRVGGILTMPFNRPIKAVYIRKLVALMDAHLEAAGSMKDE